MSVADEYTDDSKSKQTMITTQTHKYERLRSMKWSCASFYLTLIPEAAVQAQVHFISKKRWIAAIHYLSCNCILKGNLTMTSPLCSQSCLLICLHYPSVKVPGLLYYKHILFASRRCQRSIQSFELEVTTFQGEEE